MLTRWAWSFFTHGRGSRLITEGELLPPIEEPEPPGHAAARGGLGPGLELDDLPDVAARAHRRERILDVVEADPPVDESIDR